ALPQTQRKIWAAAERLCPAHSGNCACAGANGGKRDSTRALSRAAPWNSLRCQGSARCEGRAYYVGRKALCESGFRLRRHGDRAFEPRWSGAYRQGVDDRTGWGNELPVRVSFAPGRGEKSVGHLVLDLRLVVGLGRDRGGGACRVCDWHRDLGIDYLPFGVLRRQRITPYLWS